MAQVIQHEEESLIALIDSIQHILSLALHRKDPSWVLIVTLLAFTGTVAVERASLGSSMQEAEPLAVAVMETMLEYSGA